MTPGACFTSRYDVLSNSLKNTVMISASPSNSVPQDNWIALWDTGANCSVITKKVVESLNLKPVSIKRARTPSGEDVAYCYYIDLFLPNHVVISNLLVMELEPAGCDILIGMDVIGRGDFAVTNHQGKTTFSFRLPSCGEIDFVKNSHLVPVVKAQTPGRNDPCSCGSGKKYKNCCGK